jgi:uncharacterized protein (TIGR00645 family)
VLKIKLSTAIIGISSIHLLKTFINAANMAEHTIMWQVIIHVVFLLSRHGHGLGGQDDEPDRFAVKTLKRGSFTP